MPRITKSKKNWEISSFLKWDSESQHFRFVTSSSKMYKIQKEMMEKFIRKISLLIPETPFLSKNSIAYQFPEVTGQLIMITQLLSKCLKKSKEYSMNIQNYILKLRLWEKLPFITIWVMLTWLFPLIMETFNSNVFLFKLSWLALLIRLKGRILRMEFLQKNLVLNFNFHRILSSKRCHSGFIRV